MATILPEFDVFKASYSQGQNQLLTMRVPADLVTPVGVLLSLADQPYCGLFESVEKGASRSRYSFLVLDPDLVWRYQDNAVTVDTLGTAVDVSHLQQPAAIDSLRKLWRESQITLPAGLPSMAAGLFGFMGYEMVTLVEPKVGRQNPDPIGLPDSVFIRPQLVIIFDAVSDEVIITAPVYCKDHEKTPAKAAYDAAVKRIEAMAVKLMEPASMGVGQQLNSLEQTGANDVQMNMSKDAYLDMVNKGKEYIVAGDILQVVLSQRFIQEFPYSETQLYRALRRLNPAPFSFCVRLGNFALVGASPEILVRVEDGVVTVRPIAGTRKRGITKEEDLALEKDLLADEKECAEHLMLLDLGRNDVGRIAKPCSVKVTEEMAVERYSHVMHLVSNVEGELADDKDALDALMAGFPAGTVSGAPKVRAMQIIDELEPEQRGFYAGCVGYLAADGTMDTCITLRTGLVKDNKLYVQAGGGVVADSTPEGEYQESCNKARALLAAAEECFTKRG